MLSHICNNRTLDSFKIFRSQNVNLISNDAYGYFDAVGELEYEETDRIKAFIKNNYERNIKDKVVKFDDHYLVGKLINLLNDESQTTELISVLSNLLTNKNFSSSFGGQELIEVFQSMGPALIKLYEENTNHDFYDWFSK